MKNKKNEKPDVIRETPMTYDDYAKMPEDGNRYELVDGMLEMMSPGATPKHQLGVYEISFKLKQSCEEEYVIIQDVDVILSDSEVRRPDLMMIHRSRLNIIMNRGIEGPPDLVAEVISPSSVKRDRESKMKTYANYLIPEYWLIDHANEVLEQYLLGDDGYQLHEVYSGDQAVESEHIPCVSFTMEEIMVKIHELPNA